MVNRENLDNIILINEGASWWKPGPFQKDILPFLPSELEVVTFPPQSDNYNCFIQALGFSDDRKILQETGGFIYDTFVQKLIDLGELEEVDMPKDGGYVLYRDLQNYPTMITHIGVIQGDKVLSKWAWGPLIRHDVWHVPATYGNSISYIRGIDKVRAKALYEKYKEFNIKP